MTYSQQSHEAAVVRYPMPNFDFLGEDITTDPDAMVLLDEARARVLTDRDDFAAAVEGASDHTGEPPLYAAISRITNDINDLERVRRGLIAFGRHGVTGKPYSYAGLGAAASRSEAWAKEQADHPVAVADAKKAAAELRPADDRADSADPELTAMADVDQLMANATPGSRADVIARNGKPLYRINSVKTLPADAADRVVAWAVSKYDTASKEN